MAQWREEIQIWGFVGWHVSSVQHRHICVWVSTVYAPVNAENKKGGRETDEFWCELDECVQRLLKVGKIILLGDVKANVGKGGHNERGKKMGCKGQN